MVTICLQCGDRGFSNALVYCVKCLEFAVHRYCLDELPDTFDEFVPWVCDHCEVEVPQQVSSLDSEPIQLDNWDNNNSKHVEPSVKGKSKRRKTGNVVLDAAEHICDGIPSEQSYNVHAEVKLTNTAGDCSPLEVNKKACGGLEFDHMNNDAVVQHSQSSDDDVLLWRMKTKKIEESAHERPCQTDNENNLKDHDDSMKLEKKQASPLEAKKIEESVRELSSEKLVQRLEYSAHERSCQTDNENNLSDHDDSTKLEKKQASPLDAENNKKPKKKNKESARNSSSSENIIDRIGYSLSERPCESHTENNLDEHKESTKLEEEEASLSDVKMEFNGHRSCEVDAELESTVTGNQVVEFSPLNKTNKKKRVVNTLSTDLQGLTQPENPRFVPGHPSDNVTIEHYELAQPLADPIWRGSFNILNEKYEEFEGMVAHLSKKACQKAYEEASFFPTLLDLQMHPKLDIWPKSFKKSEPSDDNIALYFFPMHKRYERMFDHLVEEMRNYELGMRAILKNAELLVFTSTELPLSYWRFQGKYYLWGVFRGKLPPSAELHLGTKEDPKYEK